MARTVPRATESGDRRLGRQLFTILVAATLAVVLLPGAAGANPPHSHLSFHATPGSGVSGQNLSPQPEVWVLNWKGHLATDDDTTQVTLAVATGDGTLACDHLTVTVTDGVAAFSGCKITLDTDVVSDLFTLRATSVDPSVSSATSGSFTITKSPGPADHLRFADWPVSGVSGVTWASTDQPVVAIVDADGAVVDDDTTAVTLSLAYTGGTYGELACTGGLTETAVNGYATFSGCTITLKPAGWPVHSFQLQANATGLTLARSGAFDVSHAGGSYLVFSTQPGGGVAGTAWSQQPVVAIVAPTGSVATGDSSTLVTLSIATNPTGGTLSCTSGTTVRAVSGYATFAGCRIDIGTTAATFRLAAQSSPALTPATSIGFSVVPAGTYLAFSTQPGGGLAGAAWGQQPVVAIRNASGVVTGDSSTLVTLAIGSNPTGGTLSCTSGTTVRAVSGYAAFTGCRINVGTSSAPFTLIATSSPALTTAVSSGFYVSPAVAKLTLGLKSGVGWIPAYYTATGKYVPVGAWVTFRIATSPSLAGKYVGIYIATASYGYWGPSRLHAWVRINAYGIGYYHYRVTWPITRYFTFRYPGDGLVSSAISNSLWVRWR